jgi:ribonuclease HI
MCYGWLITRRGKTIAQGHGSFVRGHDANSALAEYVALIEGLNALLDLGVQNEAVEIRGDAKSVIDQMRGASEVSASGVKPLYRRACRLVAHLPRVTWVWKPRRENRAADLLSRKAMRQLRMDKDIYQPIVQDHHAHPLPQRLLPITSVCLYL